MKRSGEGSSARNTQPRAWPPVVTDPFNVADVSEIFDAAPGEILVARNVANLVPRYEPPTEEDPSHQHGTSAALEFAVRALKVHHIVVLGHAFCGGIEAFARD